MTGRVAGIAVLAALLMAGCGGGDDNQTPVTPSDEPETAAEYTDRGWERFEVANFNGALSDFNAAIFLDNTYGEAHKGQGWTRLSQATSRNSMRGAVDSFVNGIINGENGADVLSGRAAANLGAGGTSLEAAIVDARAALVVDAEFVFTHRPSFNAVDLHLIDAFAKAGQADYSAALSTADLVLDSGIEEGNPDTWVVDETTYDSFIGAVLAHLYKLSEQFSG
ncbi:MAG: hypothetical protein KAH56_05695 [Candidatus Krumholzibacteria bacterium]|nr:hypothetical protein [Candidatus Krumholzibacteria bacterium]